MEKPLFNLVILALSALIPMIVGFIWYNPKVMGKIWMESSGMTDEKVKNGNMPLIFGLSYVLSFFIAFALAQVVIHQNGLFSLFEGNMEGAKQVGEYLTKNFAGWENNFRDFGHGAFHGFFTAFTVGIPVLVTNALFERKGFKYIWVNGIYWIISMTLMGGVICQFS